jgi:hypothetical protein
LFFSVVIRISALIAVPQLERIFFSVPPWLLSIHCAGVCHELVEWWFYYKLLRELRGYCQSTAQESAVSLSNGGYSTIRVIRFATDAQMSQIQFFSVSASAMSLSNGGYSTIRVIRFATDAQMSQIQFFSVSASAMSLPNGGCLFSSPLRFGRQDKPPQKSPLSAGLILKTVNHPHLAESSPGDSDR